MCLSGLERIGEVDWGRRDPRDLGDLESLEKRIEEGRLRDGVAVAAAAAID